MGGIFNLYLSFFSTVTLKKTLPYKKSLLLITINLALGGLILSFLLYGLYYILWGIFLTAVPGILFIFYTAFVTHIALKIFSNRSFAHTLTPYALATIPALFSWIPFVYYITVLMSIYILIKGLMLQHHIKWYKAVLAFMIVMVINYALILAAVMFFGGIA